MKEQYTFCDNKIGIPRAVSYYNNYPFYHGFLKALGFEVILSDKTTTALINKGCEQVVSDTCLPVKVFVGHVLNLLEKGVDKIFVPSLQSTGHKINNCSKVRGLPEIIRNVVNRPFTLIEPTLDKTENLGIKEFCLDLAKQLGVEDEDLVGLAMQIGWEKYDNFIKMVQSGVAYETAMSNAILGKLILNSTEDIKPLSVVVMGHGYNLFDERISLNLLKKLENMGVKSYTGLDISKSDALKSIQQLGEIQYWANELELTGAAAYFMLNKKIDGIIALSAFGCGPDSLMIDEIQYHAKERNIPMVILSIDEHTGEAGFITRLEAFVDMLIRRKRRDLQKQVTISQPVQQAQEKVQTTVW